MKKLKVVLKADIRVENNALYTCESEGIDQEWVSVPKSFKDGDKVRVTVELLERGKKEK